MKTDRGTFLTAMKDDHQIADHLTDDHQIAGRQIDDRLMRITDLTTKARTVQTAL